MQKEHSYYICLIDAILINSFYILILLIPAILVAALGSPVVLFIVLPFALTYICLIIYYIVTVKEPRLTINQSGIILSSGIMFKGKQHIQWSRIKSVSISTEKYNNVTIKRELVVSCYNGFTYSVDIKFVLIGSNSLNKIISKYNPNMPRDSYYYGY